MYRRCGIALAAVVLAATAAGCGGSDAAINHVTFVASGQLPPSAIPSVSGKSGHGLTATTVPLAAANPTTSLFTALGIFQACLSGLGTPFMGVPSAGSPNSPADNPSYIKNLQTCAAKSNILQALKTEQSAQDNLTLAQVKKENQDYLRWRTCMIGRGWGIPAPTPNSKGLLFSFGGSSGGSSGFKPPPGQNILSSSDLQACAAKAQAGGS
jgi:hypothetical protein